MFRTIMPTAGTPYRLEDIGRAILGAFEDKNIIEQYKNSLKSYLNVDNLLLVNSGTTACFILLQLFKHHRKNREQNEVIIPDYTAPSLLLPIRQAGLDAVVVDTDPQTFNIDISKIEKHISNKTLAIMPVHMFGIPTRIQPILEIAKKYNIFVFEDAASSLGSQINGKHTGAVAPFGFYSMNRGKNISTLSGGIITWKDTQYSPKLQKLCNNLPELSTTGKLLILLKIIGLGLAVRPPFYTLLYAIISRYKYTDLHTDFRSFQYTTLQAAEGKNIWKRAKYLTQKRIENGQKLYSIFQDQKGLQVADPPNNTEIAFNQFPILFQNLEHRAEFRSKLLNKGIETSLMYGKALHQIYPNLDSTGQYSNAEYLAQHLLLIPPHPQINDTFLSQIKDTIENLTR